MLQSSYRLVGDSGEGDCGRTEGGRCGMATREDFLKAIVEEPDDDTHRLVFADWLDENDEPERAELIRVQCELARGVEGPRRLILRRRESELIEAHSPAWL